MERPGGRCPTRDLARTLTGPLPSRLFCRQVVTDTGAKLSKSLIRDGRATLPDGAAAWMLDTRDWPGSLPEYVEWLRSLAGVLLSAPRHFFRSYPNRRP